MSDYLDNLVARSFDTAPVVRPRPLALFEPRARTALPATPEAPALEWADTPESPDTPPRPPPAAVPARPPAEPSAPGSIQARVPAAGPAVTASEMPPRDFQPLRRPVTPAPFPQASDGPATPNLPAAAPEKIAPPAPPPTAARPAQPEGALPAARAASPRRAALASETPVAPPARQMSSPSLEPAPPVVPPLAPGATPPRRIVASAAELPASQPPVGPAAPAQPVFAPVIPGAAIPRRSAEPAVEPAPAARTPEATQLQAPPLPVAAESPSARPAAAPAIEPRPPGPAPRSALPPRAAKPAVEPSAPAPRERTVTKPVDSPIQPDRAMRTPDRVTRSEAVEPIPTRPQTHPVAAQQLSGPRERERRAPAEMPPVIRVHIGRVEVRAVMPAERRAPPQPPARSGPKLSLDEYLRQREGGQR